MSNPLADDEDFYLPVRKPTVARPMTDEEVVEHEKGIACFRTKLFEALKRSLPKP